MPGLPLIPSSGIEVNRVADEPPQVGTPDYEVVKYQRVAASLSGAFGAEARVALVASFEGNGDTVDVCDVLQQRGLRR